MTRAGASVTAACRSEAKSADAVTRVRTEVPAADIRGTVLDLGALASVRRFATDLQHSHDHLDILVNNAGVMMPPRTLTEDGFENQFGTNHLAHFALTGLLFPLLESAPNARVVTVTSTEHKPGRIHWDDLDGAVAYSPRAFYQQSKFANAVFGLELHRRLHEAGKRTASLLAHPGYSATNLQSSGPTGITKQFMRITNRILAQDPRRGVLPQLFAATGPTARGGDVIGPDGPLESRGYPTRVSAVAAAHDPHTAAELWSLSERLTSVTYPIP
ncbi:oxidoreductase [Mycolicibacterium agri]|uniref:Short-chain dehydrogenase n=1 Tax=Mycolicibacterium agri TaxID=36811 RepID=A0A7I9W900_MYCAG|nr:oxidoreductase [Mycolicibacterium agri]GFG53757.1 short-chain dehydrogenase [Mycolicibacterium agri]